MRKNAVLLKILVVFVLAILICGLVGYAPTITSFTGDSYTSYGWARHVWQDGGGYLDWDTGPGLNQLAFCNLFSYLIGKFTTSSPVLFFMTMNLSEFFFLLIAIYIFLILTNRAKQNQITPYMYLAPAFMVVWVILNLTENSTLLLFSDLYFLTTVIHVILFAGFFINILNFHHEHEKIPLWRTIFFMLFAYYEVASNLRFATNGLCNYLGLLGLLFLTNLGGKAQQPQNHLKQPKQKSKNIVLDNLSQQQHYLFPAVNFKTMSVWTILLIVVIAIGYVSNFAIESYSSSPRYFSGAAPSATAVMDNPLGLFENLLTGLSDSITSFILGIVYLFILVFGVYIWFKLFNKVGKTKILNKFPISAFFASFTLMSLISIILIGVLKGGLYFWSSASAHYLDTSFILAYITFSALLIDIIKPLRKNAFLIAILLLGVCTVYAAFSFMTQYKKVKMPFYSTYLCIKHYQQEYGLKEGVGDYWSSRAIRMYGDKSSQLNMHVLAFNPPLVNPFWLNNLYQEINTINFLVYMNKDPDYHYTEQAYQALGSMVPMDNLTTLNCNDGDESATILVFDDKRADIITQVFKQYAVDARSFFAITNYGFGQTIWKYAPWNQKYIAENHTYLYNGIMLQKMNQQVSYKNNPDLSITVDGFLDSEKPILGSGYIHTGNGKFSTQITYASQNDLYLVVVDLASGSAISSWTLPATSGALTTSAVENFTLNDDTSISVMIVSQPQNSLAFTIKSLSLSWNGFNHGG